MQSTHQISRPGSPDWPAYVELLKPITWFPPMWAFGCGVVSSGVGASNHWLILAAGIILTGPMVCGASQVVNDWFDRHVDAINEPGRPIPSGRVPGSAGLFFAIVWTLLSLFLGALLGTWVLLATIAGLALAWAYSAPPFRLKRNGWWGNGAVGLCYEGLAWVTGAAVMLGGQMPGVWILVFAGLYSFGAHGIMTLNDFKSICGDRETGIRSIPARYGIENATWIACIMMAIPQVVVVAILYAKQLPWHATAIAVLLVLQVIAMLRLFRDPYKHAPWYNGTGVTLYVLGMLISAFALRIIS